MTEIVRITAALAWRECLHFIRQPLRVIGSIAQPLLFWAFLGAGFSASFRAPGMEHISYLEYFYPGVMVMMALFASVFASMSVIEDRQAGFLQGVLVSPVPRICILLGKTAGGMAIALLQTILFLAAAPALGLFPDAGAVVLLLIGLVLMAAGFSALGFILAWEMRSTSSFHAVMMVFLMPLWLLSGALFPLDNAPFWLHEVMMINPVYHALILIRLPFYTEPAVLLSETRYWVALGVTLLWVGVCFGVGIWRIRRQDTGMPDVSTASDDPKMKASIART